MHCVAASLPPARVYKMAGRAAEYVGPGVAVDWIEVEGPIHDAWPPESHRRIFADLPALPLRDRSASPPRRPLAGQRRPARLARRTA